jgi:hypothetical protein
MISLIVPAFNNQPSRFAAWRLFVCLASPLFELARVFVCLNHIASRIVKRESPHHVSG